MKGAMMKEPKTKFERFLYRLFTLVFGEPKPVPEPEPAPPAPGPVQPEPQNDTTPPPVATDATPEPTGPRITRITHSGDCRVRIYTEGCGDWPIREGKKATKGKLMMRSTQMKKAAYVDAMRPDQLQGAPKDLTNAFGPQGAEHTMDVRDGEAVEVWIASYDGRQTAVYNWTWPFAST